VVGAAGAVGLASWPAHTGAEVGRDVGHLRLVNLTGRREADTFERVCDIDNQKIEFWPSAAGRRSSRRVGRRTRSPESPLP
jgi:hypothetical protein